MVLRILEQVPSGHILDRCPQRPASGPPLFIPVAWPTHSSLAHQTRPLVPVHVGGGGAAASALRPPQHPLAKVRWGVGDGRAHPPGNVSLP